MALKHKSVFIFIIKLEMEHLEYIPMWLYELTYVLMYGL